MKDEQLFHEALAKPAERRVDFIDAACGEDADLRQRVGVLLQAHDNPGSFLNTPGQNVDIDATIAMPVSVEVGSSIGPYKIREQIGEGGMGVVFVAEQIKPIRRKVALKIIKPGMDTKQVIGRFEAERQALALMDNPNIARVHDAGATDTGRPYFVMELVRGLPMTEYCDKHQLSTKDRLALFITVCRAVQHAHLKGIIHRDLKPSNVLVTRIDGEGVPKVIDFGVAKATNQQLTERSIYTHYSQMVGTPLYMSPEQAEMSGVDIDTRTDVYSLGVLLYELLTGCTPFDRETMRQATHDEMRRIIREDEPLRPSLQISTLKADAITTHSQQRASEPRKLELIVRGELDWIVMKALDKDRNRRYESANELAQDVERYIGDEPVMACPPSTVYKFRKLARRNKTALLTLLVVSAALLIGMAVSVWQLVRATDAEAIAGQRLIQVDQQRMRAEGNFQLAMQAMDEVYLKSIGKEKLLRRDDFTNPRSGPRDQEQSLSEMERQLLQRGLAFYDQLAQRNSENPDALFMTSKAFYRVALLQVGLDENDRAIEAFAEAISRLKRLTKQNPDEPKYLLELGRAYFDQAQLSSWWPKATSTFQEAKAALSRAIELDAGSAEAYQIRSKVNNVLTDYENAVSDLEAATRLEPENAEVHYKLAHLRNTIQYMGLRDYDIALLHAKEAVRLAPQQGHYRVLLVEILARQSGGKESAAIVLEQGIEFTANPLGKARQRSRVSELRGNHRQTIEHTGTYLELLKESSPDVKNSQQWHLAMAYVSRAKAYKSLGEIGKSLADLQLAVDAPGGEFDILFAASGIYRQLGEKDKSLTTYTKCVEVEPNNNYVYSGRAGVYKDLGRHEEAIVDYDRAIELAPRRSFEYKYRASSYFELGNHDEALADLTTAIELNPGDLSALRRLPLNRVALCPDERFRAGLLALADKAVELNDKAARAYAARGYVLAMLGRKEKAFVDLKAAFDALPAVGQWLPTADERRELSLSSTCYELSILCGALIDRYDMIPYLDQIVELNPKDARSRYRIALAQLETDQLGSYRESCVAMAKQFQDTKSASDSYLTAWTCLLAPEAVDDYAAVVRLSQQAVDAEPENQAYFLGLGASQFRAGQYTEALENLSVAVENEESSTTSSAYTVYFRAMSEWQLDRKEDARKTLKQANEMAHLELNNADAPPVWNRRLTLELLGKEATDLITRDRDGEE